MFLISQVHSVVNVVTLNHIETVRQIPSNIPVVIVHFGIDIQLSRVVCELLQCRPSSLAAYSDLALSL
jgi:hypothetical protein